MRAAVLWLSIWFIFCAFSQRPDMNLVQSLEFPRDAFGRDLFLLTGAAARGSLVFAGVTLLFTSASGLLISGAIALSPRPSREFAERLLDFFIAFPSLLLSLAGQAVLGTGSTTLVISLALGLLPATIRFLLARAKEVAAEEYVIASIALGTTKPALLRRHLSPALLAHLRLKLPFLIAQAISIEATLSFLGLGASPGTLTWGALLAQAKDYLIEAPYISWIVGTPLLFTLLAFLTLEERFGKKRMNRRGR